MKTIRFKNDYCYSRQGDVIEEGDGVALLLIARGIAEEVTPEEDNVEDTSAETGTPEAAESESNADQAQDGGETALPQIITRQVPGPQEASRRRGGRG